MNAPGRDAAEARAGAGDQSPASPLLAVRDLEAGYGTGPPALRGVSFTVAAGTAVAVLGPNGGGKTTLLRALLGDVPRRRGEVELAGEPAYVPQTDRTRLDFPLSALDVATMGTYAATPWYRPIGAAQRRLARESLARVGLEAEAASPFGALSGGQRQRVLIARALARRARILLLDEPLSGVDRPSSERILRVLAELRAEGCAVLMSTHDIEQARALDAVLCLHGEQVYHGPPAGLTEQVLRRTYGDELIVLEGGERAVVVQHHEH